MRMLTTLTMQLLRNEQSRMLPLTTKQVVRDRKVVKSATRGAGSLHGGVTREETEGQVLQYQEVW